MRNLTAISLFSGAGGLDLGFARAGFNVLVCVELDPSCCDTLRKNMKNTKVLQADISTIEGGELLDLAGVNRSEIDILIGGPPCQSFSLAGDRKGLNDPRGQMIAHFVRLVGEIEPKAFVMENVKGMVNWGGGAALKLIEQEFENLTLNKGSCPKYSVAHQVLNAMDYGVPQQRERVFIVGNRMSKKFEFPRPTHSLNYKGSVTNQKPVTTVGDAILSLPPADEPSKTALRVSETIKGRRVKHGY